MMRQSSEFRFRGWHNAIGMVPFSFDYMDNTVYHAIMQWTGLVDKNGKDVYEHDVVKYNDSHGMVFFAQGMFAVNWIEDITGFKLEDCEIIGNVHEDSKLREMFKK